MSEAAIRFIEPPTPHDRIIAYEIDGHFSAEKGEAWAWLLE